MAPMFDQNQNQNWNMNNGSMEHAAPHNVAHNVVHNALNMFPTSDKRPKSRKEPQSAADVDVYSGYFGGHPSGPQYSVDNRQQNNSRQNIPTNNRQGVPPTGHQNGSSSLKSNRNGVVHTDIPTGLAAASSQDKRRNAVEVSKTLSRVQTAQQPAKQSAKQSVTQTVVPNKSMPAREKLVVDHRSIRGGLKRSRALSAVSHTPHLLRILRFFPSNSTIYLHFFLSSLYLAFICIQYVLPAKRKGQITP